METIAWVSSISNLLSILAIIAGLWIAAKILPTVLAQIHSKEFKSLLSRPIAKIILWAALGSIFSLPLMDLVLFLGDMANLILNPQEGAGFSTLLGTIPQVVYFAFFPLLMLLVYGLIFWFSLDFMSTSGQLHPTQRIFLVLTIASLVHQAIRVIFSQVFSFQIPIINIQQNYGIPGFLVEVGFGFVILLLIFIGLKKFLSTHPASSK